MITERPPELGEEKTNTTYAAATGYETADRSETGRPQFLERGWAKT